MADVTSRLRLVVDSTGVDKAGRSLRDLRGRAREADEAARRMKATFAGIAGVIGAAFSTQAIFNAVGAFDEAARASAKVEQAIRSTGGAAGFTANELKKIAVGLQAVTLTDADQFLNEATAQLLTFTNIAGDEFLRTQKVALDLATVLDGDLKSAAIQLGKALNDPVSNLGALSRSGIQFSESQKEIIKTLAETGRLAEAQRVILAEIERQYGGQAEAAARVGAGVLTQIKNIVGDIQELFGEKIVNAISGPATALRDFLAVAENQERVILTIQALAAAVTVLAAPALVSGIIALVGAFAALASPIGLIAAAVGGLVLYADDLAEWAFGVRDAGAVVQAAFEAMGEAVRVFVESVMAQYFVQRVTEVARYVIDVFKALAQGAIDTLAAIEFLVNKSKIDNLTKQYDDLIDRQRQLGEELKKAQASPVADALAGLGSDFEKGSDLIKAQLDEVNGAIAKTSDELNTLLNPGGTFADIADSFDGIAERAKEISDAKIEQGFEAANEPAKELLKTTTAISKEAEKAAKQLASGVSSTFLDIKFGEKLDPFVGIDLQRLTQGQRDLALRDFEQSIRDLEQIIEGDKDLTAEARAQYLRRLADVNDRFLDDYQRANEDHADRLRSAADRLRSAIAGATSDLLNDLIFNGGRGFGDFFRGFGQDVVNDNLIRPIAKAFAGDGDIIGNITKAFDDFGEKFQKIGQSIFGKGSFGSAAGTALGAASAGFAGFQLGSGISDLLGITGNKKSQQAGGAIGGGIGAIGGLIVGGPVGAAIGAAIGSALGNLLGGLLSKPSDNAAGGGVNFTTFLPENQFAKNNDPETIKLRDELLGATATLAQTLAELTGSTFAGPGISIQAGRRNGTRIISAAGGDVTTPVGDAQAALDEIFRQLAVSLRGGDAALISLTRAAATAKVDVDQVVGVLSTFNAILEDGKAPVSKYGEAIKQLDAVLAQVANSAAVRAQSIALLRGAFEDDITKAIEEIKDPAVAGFRELARNLATVLNDATALGVDISPTSDVMELIGLQIEAFFQQAADGGADITDLTSKLSELGDILEELGIDANVAAQALQKAQAAQRDTFNEQIQADIGNFLDGPLDQLEKLLETQAERLAQAEALGADLAQVERLSALELRQFFEGLSDSAIDEVRDFLGLFEEASDSVARNLDLSRQDLQGRADQFGQFAQQFASLSTDFRERFVAASPRESLDILRGRAGELLGQIGEGNESAAQALPQVLNQLVESARQSFGNTREFQDVLDFALGALSEAEQSALGVQTDAERQIAALDESNDLLADIRDILKSSQAFNALLSSASSGGVASSAELLALIQSGAGLTPASANDNATALSVTSLIGQSLAPIIAPLVNAIGTFTQTLAEMPYLQRLQIEATDRVASAIDDQTIRLEDKLDRIEVIQKQALAELQAA